MQALSLEVLQSFLQHVHWLLLSTLLRISAWKASKDPISRILEFLADSGQPPSYNPVCWQFLSLITGFLKFSGWLLNKRFINCHASIKQPLKLPSLYISLKPVLWNLSSAKDSSIFRSLLIPITAFALNLLSLDTITNKSCHYWVRYMIKRSTANLVQSIQGYNMLWYGYKSVNINDHFINTLIPF